MDKRWFVLIGILIVLGFFVFSSFGGFRSGNVVLTYEQSFNQGENLSGNFVVGIEQGDSVSAETPILVSFSKNGKEIDTKSMAFREFVALSNSKVGPIARDGKEFYEAVESYSVPINKIISYTFNDKANYELLFVMPELDISKVTKININ